MKVEQLFEDMKTGLIYENLNLQQYGIRLNSVRLSITKIGSLFFIIMSLKWAAECNVIKLIGRT